MVVCEREALVSSSLYGSMDTVLYEVVSHLTPSLAVESQNKGRSGAICLKIQHDSSDLIISSRRFGLLVLVFFSNIIK